MILWLFSHHLGLNQQEIGQTDYALRSWSVGIEMYTVLEKSRYSVPKKLLRARKSGCS